MEVFRALGMVLCGRVVVRGLIGLQTVESKREGGACSLVFFPETNFGATACVDVTLMRLFWEWGLLCCCLVVAMSA